MSETDDTDDLLLIPPDLYTTQAEIIESYQSGPYFGIVDELINQVDLLQNRVNCMELSGSLIEFSEDDIMDNRKFSSTDDLLNERYVNSTLSTPQKPRVKYKMNSLPTTPTSPLRTLPPHRRIIENNINSNSARAKLQFDNKDDFIEVDGRVINLKHVEVMMDELEFQKSETEKRLQYRERVQRMSQNCVRKNTWRMGDDDSSIPDYRYGMKNQMRSGGSGFNHLTVSKMDSSSNTDTGERSESSSGSTQVTTRLNTQLKINKSNNSGQESHSDEQSGNSQLLSLKYLWGQNKDASCKSLQEKLEEEKLRRLHCEQLIQELQSRNLELQEKIAVAIDVDQAKDKALLKLHDAVEQLKSTNDTLSREREHLEIDLKEIQSSHLKESNEISNKITHHETETTKALELLQKTEDRLVEFERENHNLQQSMEQLHKDFQEAITKQQKVSEKNKHMNEIIVQKELELKENKTILLESKNEVANSKKAVDACQSELINIKSDYAQLESLLNDKQNQIKELQTQKRNILSDNEHLKHLYKKAEEDFKNVSNSLEKDKSDLKNYYQGQVELVVREKLKEFQNQLDKAENSLQDEIKIKELSIAKTAAAHIQQLSEKHAIEVSLLEEKHREEARFSQLQLSQSQQKIDNLQLKIRAINDRRSNIAEQLHKVMEAQWLEALKIINNGKSPYSPQDTTLDQLNKLKNVSFINVEDVLSDKTDEDHKKVKGNMPLSSNNSGQLTYRLEETPLTSRPQHKNRAQHENEMQKYVQLLLNKQIDVSKDNGGKPEINGDSSSWQGGAKDEDESKNKGYHGPRRSYKPPWK